jgi:D-alanyl-D-alanine carboxypeptidase (penicillin-binding protein 5/6)
MMDSVFIIFLFLLSYILGIDYVDELINMKKILIIVAFLCLLLKPAMVYADEEKITEVSTLYAKAAVLMDADSGRVLYNKNGYEALPMASTTKIMTLILALENGNLDDTVTVTGYAASMPQVRLGMVKGEEYRLGDLLYSLMLESHNDSAVAIAEHISGSVEEFALLMNRKALEIGCENTYYITPNGLDAEDNGKVHSTTARDLALVMSYCVKKSEASGQFLEITRTRNYLFSDLSGKRSFSCTNHNSFLDMMDGALSGKTGFTGNAGYCYVGALENNGRTFVVALLACGWPNNKTYKWSDTKALMKYGIDNYTYKDFDEISISDIAFDEISVTNAVTENYDRVVYVKPQLAEKSGVSGIVLREDEEIEVIVHRIYNISAPLKKDTVIGYISYNTSEGEWMRQYLKTTENIGAVDFSWCAWKVLERWLIKN